MPSPHAAPCPYLCPCPVSLTISPTLARDLQLTYSWLLLTPWQMNRQYQHSLGIILLSAIARMQTPWSVWLKFKTGNSMAQDRYNSILNIVIMFYFILIVIIL